MANLARLSVSIGADPTPLMSGVKRAQNALKGFDGNTKNIGKNLSHSFQKPQKSIQGSTMAVVNFNRVIQDAPFGIMGVANNLEPLITSFQGLGDETTTTAGKMGMLLKKAFTGPGALITAVSVASSLAIVFSQRLRGAGDAGDEAKEKLEATSSAVDELNSKFQQFANFSLRDEINAEINAIDQAIKISQDREKSLERVNELFRLQQGGYVELTKAQKEEIQALKISIDESEKLIKLLGFEEVEIGKLTDKRDVATTTLETYNKTLLESAQIGRLIDQRQSTAQQTLDAYTAGVDGSDEALNNLIKSFKAQIQTFRQSANAGNTQLIPVIIALQKELKSLEDAIPEKDILPDAPSIPDVEIERDVDRDTDYIEESFKEAFKNVERDIDGLDLNPNFRSVIGSVQELENRINTLRMLQSQATNQSQWQAYQEAINQTQQSIDGITGATMGAVQANKALLGFSNAVGNAFQRAVIEGKRLDNVLKGILAQLASRAFVTGLGALLTGGASLGGKSFLSNVFGGFFAKGGKPPMGKISVVGESGPEFFVPSTRGTILPNDSFSAPQGGTMSVEVFGTLKGEDIFISSNRGSDTYNR